MKSSGLHAVFMLLPERSSFNGSFKLAKELRLAGIRVTYIGPPSYEDIVTAQSLDYAPLLPDPDLPDEALTNVHWALRSFDRLRQAKRAFAGYLAGLSVAIDRLEHWLREHSPSIALVEPMMWEFSPPLLRAEVPIIGLSNTLTARRDVRFPPVFSSTVAMDEPTFSARMSYAAEWQRVKLRFLMDHAIESMQTFATVGPWAYPTARPRARVQSSGGRLCFGDYGLRLRVPELVLAPKELDFPQTARQADRHYAGSCVDIDRKDAEFDWGAIEKQRELVYCSLGTYSQFYSNTTALFQAVIKAVLLDPGLQAVIHVGSTDRVKELGPQPTRVRLVEQVPQLEILRHASVFITHGGIGAVREGLFFGVPMVVLPCWLDQFGNAARLVHHGVAVRADRSRADAGLMRKLLDQARSPYMRPAVQRMRDTFRQQQSCQEGVRWIESCLHRSSYRE